MRPREFLLVLLVAPILLGSRCLDAGVTVGTSPQLNQRIADLESQLEMLGQNLVRASEGLDPLAMNDIFADSELHEDQVIQLQEWNSRLTQRIEELEGAELYPGYLLYVSGRNSSCQLRVTVDGNSSTSSTINIPGESFHIDPFGSYHHHAALWLRGRELGYGARDIQVELLEGHNLTTSAGGLDGVTVSIYPLAADGTIYGDRGRPVRSHVFSRVNPTATWNTTIHIRRDVDGAQ